MVPKEEGKRIEGGRELLVWRSSAFAFASERECHECRVITTRVGEHVRSMSVIRATSKHEKK